MRFKAYTFCLHLRSLTPLEHCCHSRYHPSESGKSLILSVLDPKMVAVPANETASAEVVNGFAAAEDGGLSTETALIDSCDKVSGWY